MSSAREAFRAQAIDFLEKPLDQERLIQAIEEGFKAQSDRRNQVETKTRLSGRLSELTPREREVMELVVAGNHNRHIAAKLGISVRTVEVHKARMMTKLEHPAYPSWFTSAWVWSICLIRHATLG